MLWACLTLLSMFMMLLVRGRVCSYVERERECVCVFFFPLLLKSIEGGKSKS